jgi:hypothetical protein
MRSTVLLKSISEYIKKHENFFTNNPEIFEAVQTRLLKAIDDEYDETAIEDLDDPDMFGVDPDESGLGEMFDAPPEEEHYTDEDKDTDQYADEREDEDEAYDVASRAEPELADVDSGPSDATDEDETHIKDEAKEKKSRIRWKDWQPKENHELSDKQVQKMAQALSEGWSLREAHRFAGGHTEGQKFVLPDAPSQKMKDTIMEHVRDKLRGIGHHDEDNAEPELSPSKYVKGKQRQAHGELHADYDQAHADFMEGIAHLDDIEKMKAEIEFNLKWHEDNPDHIDQAVAAADDINQHHEDTKSKRSQFLKETEDAIIGGGTDEDGMTIQEAAQHVGGQADEDAGLVGVSVQQSPADFARQQFPGAVQQRADKKNALAEALKHKDHADIQKRFSALKKPTTEGESE